MKDLDFICSELRALQRKRRDILKAKNAFETRRLHLVANHLGYSPMMSKEERAEYFERAGELIERILERRVRKHPLQRQVGDYDNAIQTELDSQKAVEKEMRPHARQTPVAEWVEEPAQRGFGILSLAIVVGECGNLANYKSVGNLWSRLGCAPRTFDGETRMGAWWKKRGGLPADQWTEYKYSPRRRSISYTIGENLIRQNTPKSTGGGECRTDTDSAIATPGPYTARYEQAKAAHAIAHPDSSAMHHHRHGMLLATKLLLKNLWRAWNPALDKGEWIERAEEAAAL